LPGIGCVARGFEATERFEAAMTVSATRSEDDDQHPFEQL
jgi:hypothetical protein